MFMIELPSGDAVQIGPYTLRVLAIQAGRVVVALVDPETDCGHCGQALEDGCCPTCQPEPLLRPARTVPYPR